MLWPPIDEVCVALLSEQLPFSIVKVVSVTTGSIPGMVCVVVHLQSLLLLQLQNPIIVATAINNNTFFIFSPFKLDISFYFFTMQNYAHRSL